MARPIPTPCASPSSWRMASRTSCSNSPSGFGVDMGLLCRLSRRCSQAGRPVAARPPPSGIAPLRRRGVEAAICSGQWDGSIFVPRPRMHRIARVLGPSLPVLAGAACLAGTLHASPDLSAHALLDAYDRGDYRTVVVNLPARHEALSTFAHDLEDATVTWISNAPADVQVRRRLIAATVALEAARGFALRPDPAKMTERQWQDRQRLLEWACRLVRQTNPPSEAERWWQLASVALVEQSYGYPFYAFAGAWDDAREHLTHASARFPGEPRLALARAVVAEESAGLVGYALDGLPNAPLDQPRYDVRVRDRKSTR